MRIFHRILLLAFLSFVFVLPAKESEAGRCRAPKPILGFKATVSKTKYNISESAFDLHRMHGGSGGGLVTGLAVSPLYYEFKSLFNIYEYNGGYCVALDKVKLYYRARPFVFISSEFPRGTCEFNAVLFHENKHVKTTRRVHKEHANEFKQHVQDSMERIRPIGPIPYNQVQQTQDKMMEEFDRLLSQKLIEILNTLGKEQNKVDSPSEYARVDAECDGWVGRLRLDYQ